MAALPHPTLARIHALTGAIPLAAFVAIHLGEIGASRGGRRAFVEGLFAGDGGALAIAVATLLVILPLAAHALIGIHIAARDRDIAYAGAYGSRGERRFQRVTGLIVLVFILVHLSHTWALRFAGADATAIYEALRSDVGAPFYLAVYSIGLTAVSMHLALGLAASARTFGIARTEGGVRAARAAAWAVGVVVWLLSLNTTAHFAVGRGFFGARTPDASAESGEPSP